MPNWAIIRRSLMTDLSKKTLGKSCGEIRSCRPECPVHQGIVSECPDHHRPLPHHTAGLNSVEYDFSNSPVEGINRRIKSLKRIALIRS